MRALPPDSLRELCTPGSPDRYPAIETLTDDQIAYWIEQLEWNLLPENVEYEYDHVVDNCSTRLRDLLNDVTGGAIQLAAYGTAIERTYREEILDAGSGRMLALIAYDLLTGSTR